MEAMPKRFIGEPIQVEFNVTPEHAASAERRSSFGVGQLPFQVRTEAGQIFDLYCDRAPKDAGHRKAEWFLYQELDLPGTT